MWSDKLKAAPQLHPHIFNSHHLSINFFVCFLKGAQSWVTLCMNNTIEKHKALKKKKDKNPVKE